MYEQISSNKRKSVALFLGFLLLYGAVAAAVWWYAGDVPSIIVGVVAVVVIVVALVGGDDMAVRVAGARQIERKEEAPELWRLVENLSIVAGIPMPRIFISPDPSANAFAAGRSPEQAVVCVNQGLLELLDDRELEGVLAHELSHIRNYDVRLMTYAAVLAGSLVLVAQLAARIGMFSGGSRDRRGNGNGGGGGILGIVVLLATVILAPIGATIIQLSISRKREFVADASAAELTRYPQALASALDRIGGDTAAPNHDERTIAHMMIAPQLTVRGNASKLFSTHPPMEERVAALMQMAAGVPHQHGLPVAQTFRELTAEQPSVPPPATFRKPD
ncbi:MAG: M48 family metallopeptidase [Solirubrobacteraceae bacterium]|nr:M48 family metallopeptidase [Solirubrobacteraceae bacterium]